MIEAPGADLAKFKTPEEELAYLREQVLRHEAALEQRRETPIRDEVIRREVEQHVARRDMLDPHVALSNNQAEAIVLDLAPEDHDGKMAELVTILQEKGILNALSVVDRLNDPHVEDDFHRFLVQYVKAGFAVAGEKEKSPVWRALGMTLFEVTLAGAPKNDTDKGKHLKELVSKMEQFYAGMFGVADGDTAGYFALELANPERSRQIVFYIAVPDAKRNLFEKQAQSLFPGITIVEQKNDYNIFHEGGDYVGATAEFSANDIFPIKYYDEYDHDPLSVVLNSFSKIKEHGAGAALQIIVRPAAKEKLGFYKDVLKNLEKGKKFKDALADADTSFSGVFKQVGKTLFSGGKKKDEDKKAEQNAVNQTPIEEIRKKVASPLVSVTVRVMASSTTREEAGAILADIEAAFNQFENTRGNGFRFARVEGRKLLDLARDFSFRMFRESDALTLNLKELTTVMHLPEIDVSDSSELKKSGSATAPAPLDMPQTGILLGTNVHRGTHTDIHMAAEDRLRHFYVIGQTGTGKTTLLKTMIRQDILNGEGVCMLDPHGSDIQEILSFIPPDRYNDVIYFDPSYTARPMGLNMLEYDPHYPEQKTFVINEMLSIFNKLFDMKTAGGPMFEQYFRNAVALTIDDPSTGATLLDVSRVLSDKTYRQLKISKCTNPLVIEFWKNIAEKAGGEASLANIVPYITSKFDVFLSNEIMRPIVSQEKSVFDFRDIMDKKKILLVNLAKGRLGDINSNLLGLIIVGKILMAALSRVDSFGENLPPFYLYIDEFQNVTTDSISTIFSEARKYKLSLTVAHQFIAQLDEKIKNSVFGNVGSFAAFRVSSDDAEYLAKQFAPVFTPNDLMNVDNHHSFVKLLVGGKPAKPFSMETNLPPHGDKLFIDKIKDMSYQKYGVDRATVEAAILEKYKKPEVKPTV